MSTYDVRIWKIDTYTVKDRKSGKEKSAYRLRWRVATKVFSKAFQTQALAESFRSRLIVAQREGTAFDEPTGLPEPMARELQARSWFDHAVAFVDIKWPRAAATQRKSIAESLATVTPALLSADRGAPSDDQIRRALYSWAFNKSQREAGSPPAEHARTIDWLSKNTVRITGLKDAALIRKALDRLALRTRDGKAAAPNTVARKRAVFYGALRFAVELELLEAHPMDFVQWSAPKNDDEVDRRVVVNPNQARRLLEAVSSKDPRLKAFFGCMYFAALRPAEALHLRVDDCELPETGWGSLQLTGSTQRAGQDWSDDGAVMEDRALKHRATTATRIVPAVPELVQLLRFHIAEYGSAPDGRIFNRRWHQQGPVSKETYSRVWRQARARALTEAQQRSPLAKVPYHLRHAAVSLWLNAGVPATQVAEWAGHSVNVLLKVYAKCIDGQDVLARHRVDAALKDLDCSSDTLPHEPH